MHARHYWLALPLMLLVAVLCVAPTRREETETASWTEGRAGLDPLAPSPAESSPERPLPAVVRVESPGRSEAKREGRGEARTDEEAVASEPLERDASLEVTVLSDVGRPVPGANVELAGSAGALRATTDERGVASFRVAAGSFGVAAWSEDRTSPRTKLELEEGETAERALTLEPAHLFGGSVHDAETGEPIADAEVRVWTHNESDVVRTGPDGTFEHPRFPGTRKSQQVQVTAPGYGACVRYLKIEEDGRWSAPAALAGEEGTRGSEDPWIEVSLVPERRLGGRVLDGSGHPVASALVTAEGFFRVLPAVGSRDVSSTLTDASGRFELAGLRSDISHTLLVSAEGFAAHTLPLPAEERRALDVGDVYLEWGAAVVGVVHDPFGEPVEDARVRILPIAQEPPHSTESSGIDVPFPLPEGERTVRTDASGTFSFDRLPPRAYRLTVERDAAPLVVREVTARVPDEAPDAGLTLCTPPTSLVLEGTVVDDGEPVAGVWVRVRRHGHVARTRTGADGRFRVSGLDDEGPYRLSVEHVDREAGRKHAENLAYAHESPILRLQRKTGTSLARATDR